MPSLVNELIAESKRFLANYTNGEQALVKLASEYPFHRIPPPAKSHLQLFFMKIANGADPHELWHIYNNARFSYLEILRRDLKSSKTALGKDLEPGSPPDLCDAFLRARNSALATMEMLGQMAELFGDPHSTQVLECTLMPYLKKLRRSENWVSHGQTIPFIKIMPEPPPQDIIELQADDHGPKLAIA